VWGNVVTVSFSTEEGAFLRGQITMEEKVEIEIAPAVEIPTAITSPETLNEIPQATPEEKSWLTLQSETGEEKQNA
jgi:hypothetical protein